MSHMLGTSPPPGGQDPYWADCDYGVFVAYFVLNGFALLLSVAALCAVTWGPYVLMGRTVSAWRMRVVNVGLAHLAISLASVLGAFACAGFVTASVGAPKLNCGNLRCDQGGVPCNAFTVVSEPVHEYSMGTWGPSAYVLDAVLAKLNCAAFVGRNAHGGDCMGVSNEGQDVICRSYSYIAEYSDLGITFSDLEGNRTGKEYCKPRCPTPFDGPHGDGVLDDVDGRPIDTTCLVLIDNTTFGSAPAVYAQQVASNPYTYWCSLNGSKVGPGWLPLKWLDAQQLLEHVISGFSLLKSGYHPTSGGYAVVGPNKKDSTCPQIPGFAQVAKPLDAFLRGIHPRGVELLANLSPVVQAGPCTFCKYDTTGSWTRDHHLVAAFHYANVLGASAAHSRFNCPSTQSSAYSNSDNRLSRVLGNATYYPSLRYQCTQLRGGVLCDYSANPPLAIDAEGKLLDKKALSKQSNANV